MHPYAAFIVGFIAGATYIAWDIVLLHIKVDDPVTATSGNLKIFTSCTFAHIRKRKCRKTLFWTKYSSHIY